MPSALIAWEPIQYWKLLGGMLEQKVAVSRPSLSSPKRRERQAKKRKFLRIGSHRNTIIFELFPKGTPFAVSGNPETDSSVSLSTRSTGMFVSV